MTSSIKDEVAAGTARYCKYGFFVVLFVLLFLGAYYPELAANPNLRLAVAAGVGVLAMVWAQFDARARGLELPTLVAVGLVLLAAAVVPYWLFRTRSVQEAWLAIGRFLLWLLLLALFFSLGVAMLELQGIAPKLPQAGLAPGAATL